MGTFDGLHKAHRSIIKSVVDIAAQKSCQSVLITFEPHPRCVIYPRDHSLRLLTDLDEKIELLKATDLDHLVVFPFTAEFSQLSPEEYVERFIIEKFDPAAVIVGFDHHFGLNRQGNYQLLQQYANKEGFDLIQISKKETKEVKISSTQIREYLISGQIIEANELLGYRYFLTGEVIKGDNIGTSLGYPTANIRLGSELKLVPKSGIYAAFVYVRDVQYEGLLYIGQKPSMSDKDTIFIEVNLRNFTGYLYGEQLKIEFVEFIRQDQKFEDLDALKSKISEDEKQIVAILQAEKNKES